VGGGRDVLAAAMAGHDPIVGVEINSRIVELHTDVMRGFSELTTLPGVELVNDEARSYLTRDPRTHDVITMSLIDTWAASGAGAYSLTENSLYTVEAWVTFFRRLKPDGIFTVSRWYGREAAETARMMSLAMDSLFAIGATRPRDHIMLLKVGDVATLLVSPSPFRQADIDKAKAEAARLGFNVLYTPGGEIDDRLLASIFAAESREQLRAINERHTLDVTPP
ncbi:MAG: hypothetical protein KC457_35830, partial [Myxococcales bacterium]|nr:hypothetical protein [Myxococcales bacterium]